MVSIASDGPGGLQRLSALWQETIEYFVPDEMARDRDLHNRARMFLISHLYGPLLGNTVPLALYIFDPTPGWDIPVLTASICLFWIFPFLLRWGWSYDRLVLLSVINLNFAILFSCYHNDGVASPTLTWVLIIPILSLFYVGGETQLQPRLLAITATSFITFFLAFHIHPPEPNDIPDAAMVGLGTVSNIATLCYIAMMAIYYARVFDAGVDLEIEVRRRRQMADELRQAIMTAHRVGSAKAEFLARMSHEIRTPLNAIIGYGEILKEEAEENKNDLLRKDINRILDAAQYLVRLINMILDLAKIDAGRMVFEIKQHDLRTIIGEAVAEQQDAIVANGNRVAVEVEPGLGSVEVDRHRLAQILGCVLENAARHTRDGMITVTAITQAPSTGFFSVAVTDAGSGIDAEALASLFETFATTRSAADGRYGGTGLSLTVCSRLCRAMGGDIAVRSTPGKGSTFTISLPREVAGHADAG